MDLILFYKNPGGEGGIRTLGTVLPVQPLSRRLPSADSATSPAVFHHSYRRQARVRIPVSPFSNILAEREGFARRGSGDLACAYPAARLPFALRKVGLLLANRSAASSRSNPRISVCQTSWRRGRDSNPRGGYKPPTRFPVAFLRPARTPLREYSCAKITAEGSGSNPHASVVKHLGGGSRIRPMGLRRSRLTPPQF